MAFRIPPLLEPYLSLPPEASLILLTSVLGASTNWLVLRYLHIALVPPPGIEADFEAENEINVVLVSFLRDLTFWREGGRRLGLDLPKLTAQGRFAFVNGLSGLFLPVSKEAKPGGEGEVIMRSAELGGVYEDIFGAVRTLKGQGEGPQSRRVLLIIDSLDLLLATAGMNANAVGLYDMLMDLREHVHAIILTLSNDSPSTQRQQTPLEINHAALLMSLAHEADLTLSLRLLDTGTARDVSGVLRINVREGIDREEVDVKMEAKELLYFIAGDGNVRVFERGQ